MERMIMLSLLLALSIEDIKEREVHQVLLYIFMASGLAAFFISRRLTVADAAGGVACGLIIWLFSRLCPETMGEADGMVIASTGVYLGLAGNICLIFTSSLLAGAAAFIAAAFLKKGKDYKLPFIPFITAGALITLLLEGS